MIWLEIYRERSKRTYSGLSLKSENGNPIQLRFLDFTPTTFGP
jgi:hypothetical protein